MRWIRRIWEWVFGAVEAPRRMIASAAGFVTISVTGWLISEYRHPIIELLGGGNKVTMAVMMTAGACAYFILLVPLALMPYTLTRRQTIAVAVVVMAGAAYSRIVLDMSTMLADAIWSIHDEATKGPV